MFREASRRRYSWGTWAFLRPAASLSAGADALAGYIVASPAVPLDEEARATVPFLFASAVLLAAAGHVFAAAFAYGSRGVAPGPGEHEGDERAPRFAEAVARGETSLKRAFLAGAALALAGLFAAMGACASVGSLPVYFAAFLFLVSWARAGRGPAHAVSAPVSAGVARALALGLGMSAHREIVFLADPRLFVAAGLLFVYGALVESIESAWGEGGRRWALLGAFAGLLAVMAGAGVALIRTALAWIVALSGATFLAARAATAVRTLVPADIRRAGSAAILAGFFLDAAICFGRFEATGAVLVLGSVALALVVPGAVALESAEATYPASRGGPEGMP